MLVTQNQRTHKEGKNQVICITRAEEKNPTVCGCLSAKTYSLFAAAGFAAMAYGGEKGLNIIAYHAQMVARSVFWPTPEGIDEFDFDMMMRSKALNYEFIYPEYLFWAMAMFHLLIFFTSSPAVFNIVAGAYDLGKWFCYAMAVYLFYALYYLMRSVYFIKTTLEADEPEIGRYQHFRQIWSFNVALFLISGLCITTFGCMMSSIGDVYCNYGKYLDQKKAQEEQNQVFET